MLCKAHAPTQPVARVFDTALTRVNAEMVKKWLNGALRKRLTSRRRARSNGATVRGLVDTAVRTSVLRVMRQLIRFCLLAARRSWPPRARPIKAPSPCSTRRSRPLPQPVPKVDLTNAKWQKLSPLQPESNPLRAAVVERNDKIGATRVVLKVPPSFALPPYWLTAQGNYTVLKGTFVFQGHDADGKQTSTRPRPRRFRHRAGEPHPAGFDQGHRGRPALHHRLRRMGAELRARRLRRPRTARARRRAKLRPPPRRE